MNLIGFLQARPAPEQGFTRADLLAVIGALLLLSLVLIPIIAKESDGPERAVCLNNMRHIVAAAAMYSADNSDFVPHPSWGGNLTGPDNWCYATRLEGLSAPSAAGRTGPEAHTNQIPFYQAGQLAGFLESQRILVCPTDWREAMGIRANLYAGRPVKLTSYTMNGTIGGYTGSRGPSLVSGRTFKVSDFLPADIMIWEGNDNDPFSFTDAGNNPESTSEGLTQRHARATGEGPGVVGRFGATADFIQWQKFVGFQISAKRPNELLCGPRY